MNLRNCINGLYDLDSKRYVEYVVKHEKVEAPSPSSLSANRVKMLGIELGRAQQNADGIPSNVGVLSIKSVNQTMSEASLRSNPKELFGPFWFEGEIGCLFADSNAGKSILAVQIAEDIAKNYRVLYFDFELSDKQFQLRYTDSQGNLHHFPATLYRVSLDPDNLANLNLPFEEAVIRDIEKAAVACEANIIIIDNISILCMQMEKGDDAAKLVQNLRALKNKYGFSILIIAHTPKRDMSRVITQNDLAGSKKLFNFIDSCFALGTSAQGTIFRYLKQIKVRNCSIQYGTDNVRVYRIEKDGALLHFVYLHDSPEHEHLKEQNREELKMEVKKRVSEGLSVRDISRELGISKSAVGRIRQEVCDGSKKDVPAGDTGQQGQLGQHIGQSLLEHSDNSLVLDSTTEGGEDVPF